MKRFVSLLLIFTLLLSLVPSASAVSREAVDAANALHERGLFNGTGTNADGTPIFDLDKTPTRNQAISMLVRLLGKEGEALAGTWSIPFTDVSKNMKPYVGYAYANGLTSGMSATTYGGNQPISANQYISFVLRALGYVSGTDFTVSSATVLSNQLGITSGQYDNVSIFTRGDVAIISNAALNCNFKNTQIPLSTNVSEKKHQANNIAGNDLDSLIEYTAKCIVVYNIMFKLIGELEQATNTSEFTSYIKDAYDCSQSLRRFMSKIYEVCNGYDDTKAIMENAGFLNMVMSGIPLPTDTNNVDALGTYLQQFLSSMLGAAKEWVSLDKEVRKLVPAE